VAHDKHQDPAEFVEELKKKGVRVPGIGHRIKSKDNRDKRVQLLQEYARRFFPSTKYLDYAEKVSEGGRESGCVFQGEGLRIYCIT
jgi:ATP citrate (pro-S)-lyase